MYKQLQTEVLRRRNAKIYDSTSMDLAGKLLELNPEVLLAASSRPVLGDVAAVKVSVAG